MTNYYTQQNFHIDVHMSEKDIDLVRNFCRKNNDSPVYYPLYYEIQGPILQGKQTSVRLSFRYNHIAFEVLKDSLNFGWGLTVAQLMSLKFSSDGVYYDYKKIKPEEFRTFHPYANQLQFSNRILASLSNNNSIIANIHQKKIKQINEVMSSFKKSIKQILKNMD